MSDRAYPMMITIQAILYLISVLFMYLISGTQANLSLESIQGDNCPESSKYRVTIVQSRQNTV